LLALLERTEYPSFGYWVVNGQTSLCENFEMTHSLNHHFFSFITEYIIKYFCGIKFDEGMHSVILDPQIPESLSFIEYSINTKYGPFKMSVKQENNKQVISFSVDNNCTVCFNGKIYESGSYSIVK